MAFNNLEYSEAEYLRTYSIACLSLAVTTVSLRIVTLGAAGAWFWWLALLICAAAPTFFITGLRTLILRRRLSQLGVYTNQKIYGNADFVRASESLTQKAYRGRGWRRRVTWRRWFVVLGETWAEPGEGALDDPASLDDLEPNADRGAAGGWRPRPRRSAARRSRRRRTRIPARESACAPCPAAGPRRRGLARRPNARSSGSAGPGCRPGRGSCGPSPSFRHRNPLRRLGRGLMSALCSPLFQQT